MVRTEEREIDGLRVITTQLDFVRQSRLFARLGRLLGESMVDVVLVLASAAAKGGKAAAMDVLGKVDLRELAPALKAAFDKLSEEEHDQLLLKILAGTEVIVDGRKSDLLSLDKLNRAFDGRLAAGWKAAWFALEVNYADFFTGGSGGSDAPRSPTESA